MDYYGYERDCGTCPECLDVCLEDVPTPQFASAAGILWAYRCPVCLKVFYWLDEWFDPEKDLLHLPRYEA